MNIQFRADSSEIYNRKKVIRVVCYQVISECIGQSTARVPQFEVEVFWQIRHSDFLFMEASGGALLCSPMGMTVHFSSAKGNHSILTLRVLVVFPAAHGDWQVDDTGRVTPTKGNEDFPEAKKIVILCNTNKRSNVERSLSARNSRM